MSCFMHRYYLYISDGGITSHWEAPAEGQRVEEPVFEVTDNMYVLAELRPSGCNERLGLKWGGPGSAECVHQGHIKPPPSSVLVLTRWSIRRVAESPTTPFIRSQWAGALTEWRTSSSPPPASSPTMSGTCSGFSSTDNVSPSYFELSI